jgi:hypothetical protein
MQIKAADDKGRDIQELQMLLGRLDLRPATRNQIEQEIRNIRAGFAAEQEAAYQIEFHVSRNTRIMTIHDLRIEFKDRVAQIDHLVITSLLDIWLCESKHFAEGVAINEYGEWSAYYGRKLTGIPSPIEQNKRHAIVLNDVLGSGIVDLPRRLGIARRPAIKTVVLVSKDARIKRPVSAPAAHVEGLESVIKCDQFISVMDQAIEKKSARDFMFGLAWLGTIESFARQLAALHKPVRLDWVRKFEIPRVMEPTLNERENPPRLRVAALSQATDMRRSVAAESSKVVCDSCGRSASPKEVSYCRTNEARFRGRVLCYDCQRGARQIS